MAHPMYAAAGIVVTEMATPTATLAAVSYASIPAIPAARATRTAPGPISVSDGPSTLSSSTKSSSMRPTTRSTAVVAAAVTGGHPETDAQGEGGASGETHRRPTSPDGGGGDGEQAGLSAIAPTTRIDEPSSTPTPATTPAAAMKEVQQCRSGMFRSRDR